MLKPRLRLPLVMFTSLFLGCRADVGSHRQSAIAPWDAQGRLSIDLRSDTSALCDSCIRLRHELDLGGDSVDDFVDPTKSVSLDSEGRWWVSQRGHLKIYTSVGKLLTRIGREGQGPLEFGRRTLIIRDPASASMHVLDPANQRISTLGSDLELKREQRLPFTDFFSATILAAGGSYAFNAWLPTQTAAGLAVHLLRGDSLIGSFDAPLDAVRVDQFQLLRLLTSDHKGNVFSVPRFSYRVAIFDSLGRERSVVTGPQLNPNPVTDVRYNLTDNPIPNEIVAVLADREDRLWVLSRRVRENWRAYLAEVVQPDGTLGLQVRPGRAVSADSLYTARLEIIDLNSGRFLVRTELDRLLDGFVAEGLLYQNTETDDGLPRIAIWRIQMTVK